MTGIALLLFSSAFAGLVAVPGTAVPAPLPGVLPVQGHLADTAGVPVDGNTDITFTLYDGTTTLWTDVLTIDVADGAFTARLGEANTLDLRMFADHPAVELGVAIGSDPEIGRIELGHSAYSAYAETAGEATMIDGYTSHDLRSWSQMTGRPAGLDDGDDVLSQAQVEQWSRAVCYDSPAEIAANLPPTQWADIQGRPTGLDDGDQTLTQAQVESYARGVAYDNVSELTAALDGQYLAAGGSVSWNDIADRPLLTDPVSTADVEQAALDAVRDRGVSKTVYLRDDEPETTLDNELGRLHISLTATNYARRSKLIPHDMFVDLCGDPDGCEVRVAMTRWSSDVDTQGASWGSQTLYYDNSNGRWRMSQPKGPNGGHPEYVTGQNHIDGDGTTDHLLSVWHTCYITDGVYDGNNNTGDPGQGISVLMWDTYTNPGRTCEFTFID